MPETQRVSQAGPHPDAEGGARGERPGAAAAAPANEAVHPRLPHRSLVDAAAGALPAGFFGPPHL
jgi:hypothetical protein